jgi:hypothetical protein
MAAIVRPASDGFPQPFGWFIIVFRMLFIGRLTCADGLLGDKSFRRGCAQSRLVYSLLPLRVGG